MAEERLEGGGAAGRLSALFKGYLDLRELQRATLGPRNNRVLAFTLARNNFLIIKTL